VTAYEYIRDPSEITRRSFEIVTAEAELAGLPSDIALLARRLIHASGMTDIAADLAWSADAVSAGRAALTSGAPIVCDVAMVAAGIARDRLPAHNAILVAVAEPGAGARAAAEGTTRTAAGMAELADRLDGAVVAVGNAPTALFRLLELVEAGGSRPALVLGFPVGFVGAAESKAALAASPSTLPFVTLHGRRGGSALAAAAVNALILGNEAGGT
jgi:precorrin-8X/cobalt-precorrin-8 methylmutase